MKAVLGLSVTSRGIGWAVIDGRATLDEDAFEVDTPDQLAARAAAAGRGARAIAETGGQRVTAVGVDWAQDCGDPAAFLRDMRAAGFADVRMVADRTADRTADELDARRRAAREAADAVASKAVTANALASAPPRPARPPRRFAALRAVAAVAVMLVLGVLTVASQFTEPATALAANTAEAGKSASAQVVTAAVPHLYLAPPAVTSPHEDSASMPVAVWSDPVDDQPAAAPIATPMAQTVTPLPVVDVPAGQPHLPAASVLPGPALPGPSLPGPALPVVEGWSAASP